MMQGFFGVKQLTSRCTNWALPSPWKLRWVLAYVFLGALVLSPFWWFNIITGSYLWERFRSPQYDDRAVLVLYVFLFAVHGCFITGLIVWKLIVWFYRQLPLYGFVIEIRRGWLRLLESCGSDPGDA